MNEDYTAAVLSGLPIFLVNREYVESTTLSIMKVRYIIALKSAYVVSVVEFYDWTISSGRQYEMMVTDTPFGRVDLKDGMKFCRGSAMDIHRTLTELESYGVERNVSL